jgi:hypothetical protein
VQIPLDYYRILGLPTQSTPEQLQQAHRDRVLQLPRREYSEIAIAARRDILDEAYTTLSDPALRRDYEINTTRSQSVSSLGEGKTPVPTGIGLLEVADHKVIGALLLLQELGEYELVLQVGIPLLPKKSFHPDSSGESEIVHADTALTLALAYLELGREYWQQGHYESAAESLEAGQALLLKEGLFAGVRGEIKTDLYKLRPYRVLELLALPLEHLTDRRKGLQILRDMLQERGGIDGTGDDLSGLTIDDFLRFIQQLRDYLTAEEQQVLFEGEARRPSAVATYLAVYALLARGFANCQPDLIRRTKPLLIRLAKRQDVHLEQAISALLLGQTEQASRALELSREYEAIVFIRDHSQGSPDLLPGLCLYTEQWLRQEVFPHFRDLVGCKMTLKDYFSNPQVQQYLEELPQETPEQGDEWEVMGISPLRTSFDRPVERPVERPIDRPLDRPVDRLGGRAGVRDLRNTPSQEPPISQRLPARNLAPRTAAPSSGLLLPGENHVSPARPPERSPEPPRSRRRTSALRSVTRNDRSVSSLKVKPLLLVGVTGLLFLGSLIFVGVNVAKWFASPTPTASPEATATGLQVRLDQPVLILSSPSPQSPSPASGVSELTQDSARVLIDSWLKAKAESMGQTYNLAPLTQVLTGDALLRRQQEAEIAQREGFYVEYEHLVSSIESVQIQGGESAGSSTTGFTQPASPSPIPLSSPSPSPTASPVVGNPLNVGTETPVGVGSEPLGGANSSSDSTPPPQAIVVAVVNEAAKFYQNGELDEVSSYNASGLRIQYTLEQVNGEWRIAEITNLP